LCPPPFGEFEQKGLDAEKELQEEDTFIPTRKKKKGKKYTHGVVIKEVNMKRNIDNLSILRSSQFHVVKKKTMVDKEQHSNDVLTRHEICFMESLQTSTVGMEDDVEDIDDDNISEEMNKQVPLENLIPAKARLNYN